MLADNSGATQFNCIDTGGCRLSVLMGKLWDYLLVPRRVATIFMVAVTLPSVVFLPLVEFQQHFWIASVATFVVGDSVTTGLLGRHGLEEQEVGYTRRVCGAEPTMICAFVTRVIAFAVVGTLYIAVAGYGIGVQYQVVAISTLTLPVILASGGLAATVLNGYGIVRARRVSTE